MTNIYKTTPEEFRDICPFDNDEFDAQIDALLKEPAFEAVVRMAMPSVDFEMFAQNLCNTHNKVDFQTNVMKPFVDLIIHKTSGGVKSSGENHLEKDQTYTYITNHRDIVLDSALLNMVLFDLKRNTCEIAIGNNLLIYDWITSLVRLNKCFIVKRNLGRRETLEAAIQLSKYIHYAVTEKGESVWIAQRQGRAKDSSDNTQESLIKMLGIGGNQPSFLERIREIHLMPISLSYEYDPNDYLKALEYLRRHKNPDFTKSKTDDLISMQTGILGKKGRIHFAFTPCINEILDQIDAATEDKRDLPQQLCDAIDKQIHANYHIFETNYIAYDILNNCDKFAGEYTDLQKAEFIGYLNNQIAQVREKLSDSDKAFMLEKMLVMYANPLRNKLKALARE